MLAEGSEREAAAWFDCQKENSVAKSHFPISFPPRNNYYRERGNALPPPSRRNIESRQIDLYRATGTRDFFLSSWEREGSAAMMDTSPAAILPKKRGRIWRARDNQYPICLEALRERKWRWPCIRTIRSVPLWRHRRLLVSWRLLLLTFFHKEKAIHSLSFFLV